MKTLNKTILAVLASSAVALSANAAVSYGANGVGQPYVGVKVGQFDVDLNGVASSADDPTAYGVYGGYNFDKNFGVEAEYVGSSDTDVTVNGVAGEYDAKTYGLYGTYRYHFTNTPIYAKAKLGIAKTEASLNVSGVSYDGDDTSLAGGVGIGFQPVANVGIEAGYNYLSSDANLWTVGAHFAF